MNRRGFFKGIGAVAAAPAVAAVAVVLPSVESEEMDVLKSAGALVKPDKIEYRPTKDW